MLAREKNEFGYISLNNALLEQIIDHALKKHSDNARLANYNGNGAEPVWMLIGLDNMAEKEVVVDENGVFIRLYLVIRFGQSISGICEDMIASIRNDIVDLLQLPVKNIEIVVTGVISKRIAKRNIVFRLYDEEGPGEGSRNESV
ncbi:MAG: Asp23/Gls24 family envelope stress response protein [Firmicutes bacterium]|nr:Asp23/Gls24 family envelope stress response protein [Bacillota bacterium]